MELKIPQKHIGQVLQAFGSTDPEAELDVDLLAGQLPDPHASRASCARAKIAGEARPDRDDPAQSEPVVLASVRLDGPGIDEADRLPHDLLVTGTEVHSKIRCGRPGHGLLPLLRRLGVLLRKGSLLHLLVIRRMIDETHDLLSGHP